MKRGFMKQGYKYKVLLKNKSEAEGVFVSENKEFFFLKLKSGYNIGISRDKVKEFSELESVKPRKSRGKKQETQKKGLPKITILHTGGTIASKVDYSTGAVIAQFSENDILGLFPELGDIADISSRLIRNMQSEMMRFPHYNILAEEVKKEAEKGVDGVIITQGTDTLHYTSAALAFALEGLGIPVLLVGSQRSSDRPSSDAAINISSAALFIAKTSFSGVGICMHESINGESCVILPACNTRKMHTSRRDAFKAVNSRAIARIGFGDGEISFFFGYEKKNKKSKITVKPFNDNLKIGVLKAHPHMSSSEVLAYKGFDGLVLDLFGIGHMPTMEVDEFTSENRKVFGALKMLAEKIIVVGAAQTVYGRVNMNVYTPGRQLLGIGILGNYSDITSETAFIKLAWLLSNYDREKARELFHENLRGEISTRSDV